jgi:hypothetical protein
VTLFCGSGAASGVPPDAGSGNRGGRRHQTAPTRSSVQAPPRFAVDPRAHPPQTDLGARENPSTRNLCGSSVLPQGSAPRYSSHQPSGRVVAAPLPKRRRLAEPVAPHRRYRAPSKALRQAHVEAERTRRRTASAALPARACRPSRVAPCRALGRKCAPQRSPEGSSYPG